MRDRARFRNTAEEIRWERLEDEEDTLGTKNVDTSRSSPSFGRYDGNKELASAHMDMELRDLKQGRGGK